EALAAFVRSLTARNTPYDRYVYQGELAALSDSARRGMALFFSPGLACGHCHVDIVPPERATPPRWSDLAHVATGAGRSVDRGLAEQTKNPADAYRFRVPPLRNVAVTAPYMHDGSLPTLEAVIRFYESGGRWGAGTEPERTAARHPLIAGFVVSDDERRDLIAFLEALTDNEALRNPAFANPFLADERTSSVRSLSQ
ncbi:MAG: cytochrome-c peroxidase, partial [Roseiflexaceae bacterium]|nr:cytochrome-c peroxidase [Roseiflexaceae bacterium]